MDAVAVISSIAAATTALTGLAWVVGKVIIAKVALAGTMPEQRPAILHGLADIYQSPFPWYRRTRDQSVSSVTRADPEHQPGNTTQRC
jgi:hypothetical protein